MRGEVVLAAVGLVEQCSSHATAWALISGEIGAGEMRELTEAILRALACEAYLRVDTYVRTDFARGRSWAVRLGFRREGTMRKWGPMAIDMDLTGWRLSGGMLYHFPDGTVIPGNSYLVVAANPEALEETTGFVGALGPFEGRLDNGGEELELQAFHFPRF